MLMATKVILCRKSVAAHGRMNVRGPLACKGQWEGWSEAEDLRNSITFLAVLIKNRRF